MNQKQRRNYFLLPDDNNQRYFQRVTNMPSFVWNHFRRNIQNETQVLCDYCNQIIIINSGNTTQMVNHLRRKHKIEHKNRRNRANSAADENFIQSIRNKHLKKNFQDGKNISGSEDEGARDDLFDSDEEQKQQHGNKNQKEQNKKQIRKIQSINSKIQNNFKIQQDNDQSFNQRNQEFKQQQDNQQPFMRPRRIRIIESKRSRKLRGPRGPYKKRQHTGDRQYWQSVFRNSHQNFKRMQLQAQQQGQIPATPSKSNSTQLIIIQKNTKQIRSQIKSFLQSLPYYLKLNQIIMRLLQRYSFPPGMCNQMLKKYHWITLNDRKCLNKLKSYYRHQVILKLSRTDKSSSELNDSDNQNKIQQDLKKNLKIKRHPHGNQSRQFQQGDIFLDDDDKGDKNKQQSQSSNEEQQQQKNQIPENNLFKNNQGLENLGKQHLIEQLPLWDVQAQQQQPINPILSFRLQSQQPSNLNQQNVIFICTATMRSNFAKYGSVVRMTKFNDIVNSRSPGTIAIYFTGQDMDTKPIIFGLLILKGQNYENYKDGLQYFLSSMGHEVPKVIIREINSGAKDMIEKAVQNINNKIGKPIRVISHYNSLQISQILRQVKNVIKWKNQSTQRLIIAKLSSLLNQTNNKHKEVMMNRLIKQLRNNDKQNQLQSQLAKKLKKAIKQADLNIPSWVGYNLEVSRMLKLVKLLLPPLLYRESLGKIFMALFHLENKLNIESINRSKYRTFEEKIEYYELLFRDNGIDYQIFDEYEQLYNLRIYLQPQIFCKVVMCFVAAVRNMSIRPTQQPLTFKSFYNQRNYFKHSWDKNSKRLTIPIHTVTYNIRHQCWQCSCKLQFWIGLPCCHIMKVLALNKGSLFYYIHDHWKIDKNMMDRSKISRNAQYQRQQNEDFNAIMEAGNQVIFDGNYLVMRSETEFYQIFWNDSM